MDVVQTSSLSGIGWRARIHAMAALNDGDANAWAACFDTDAVQMPPNEPPNVGSERIQEWTQAFLAAFRAEFSIVPHDVELAGPDWAFERGSYEIGLTPKNRRRSALRQRQVPHYPPASARSRMADGPRHLEQRQPATEPTRRLNPLTNRQPAA